MIVRDIYNDVGKALGTCDEKEILARLSEVFTLFAGKQEVNGIEGYADICTASDCKTFTLPRQIETPLAVIVGGHPTFMRNKWYEFHLNGSGPGRQCQWAWDDFGFFPVINDIIIPGNLIAVANLKTDLQVPLEIFGYDENDKWIRTQNPDGTWRDGFIVPIQLLSDFPSGIIAPNPDRMFKRIFTVIPATVWNVQTESTHRFMTGQAVVLSQVNPPVPNPFIAGTTYFVRTPSDFVTLELFKTREDALAGINAIQIKSDPTGGIVKLRDERAFEVETQFISSTNHNLTTGNTVAFSAVSLPSPITANTDYFARVVDDTKFTIHESRDEALAGINGINCTTPGAAITANTRQDAFAITTLTFSTNHNFLQGDAVQVFNNGGSLPFPLQAGTNYYVATIDARTITLHSNFADASLKINPIILQDAGSGISSVLKTVPATANVGTTNQINATNHNLSAGDFVQFTTTGIFPAPLSQGTVYTAQAPIGSNTLTLANTSYQAKATTQRARATGVATITCPSHGLSSGDIVDIEGLGGTGYNATQVTITVVDANSFTYVNAGADEGAAADTNGVVYKGRINITSAGTGQLSVLISRAFSIGFTGQISTAAALLASGDKFRFYSAGTLPLCNPTINGSTDYYLRKVSDSVIEAFQTQAKALDATIRQTSTRSRAANVATIVTASAHGFITGDFVDVSGMGGTGYNVQRVQITVTGSNTFTYSNTGSNEGETIDNAGQIRHANIKFLALGSGTLLLSFEKTVTVGVKSSLLVLGNSSFLREGTKLQFITTGVLPAPLALATDYALRVENGRMVILNAVSGATITLSDIGTGDHSIVIENNFATSLPTAVQCVSNVYNTGDKVKFVLGTGATAPSPLVNNTDYYVRRIDDDKVEVYNTKANAENTASTTGRIVPTTQGSGTLQFVQLVPNFKVKKIDRIRKGISNGFIELFCWDTGRSYFLTKLGDYYPDETEPRYRRIKIGYTCSWIRLRYRRKVFEFRSLDDHIPLDEKLAIILMVKAAEHYRNDFIDQAKSCETEAIRFILERQEAEGGAETYQIQVQDGIFGNTRDFIN